MRVRAGVLTMAGILAMSGAALGATFTYTSAPLTAVSNGGIVGARHVSIAFYAPAAPAPGRCVMTEKLRDYHDGADTRASLKAAGYIVLKYVIVDGSQEHKVPVTYATLCLGADGTTVTGLNQLYATTGSNLFLVSNQQPGGTDLAQFDIYFGGEIPQIYSSGSSQAGTWAIGP